MAALIDHGGTSREVRTVSTLWDEGPVQAKLRTVNYRYGLRGVRVGEASPPGPASRRRRTQRLRALQRLWDSDSESDDVTREATQVGSDSEDSQPFLRSASSPPDELEAVW